MTGHIALNLYHHQNKLCLDCLLERVAVERFLGKLPVFYQHHQRQYYFDTHFASLEELSKNTNLKNFIKYTIDTKRQEVYVNYMSITIRMQNNFYDE